MAVKCAHEFTCHANRANLLQHEWYFLTAVRNNCFLYDRHPNSLASEPQELAARFKFSDCATRNHRVLPCILPSEMLHAHSTLKKYSTWAYSIHMYRDAHAVHSDCMSMIRARTRGRRKEPTSPRSNLEAAQLLTEPLHFPLFALTCCVGTNQSLPQHTSCDRDLPPCWRRCLLLQALIQSDAHIADTFVSSVKTEQSLWNNVLPTFTPVLMVATSLQE